MSERKPKFESLFDEYLHCFRRACLLKEFKSYYALEIILAYMDELRSRMNPYDRFTSMELNYARHVLFQ